MHIRLITLRKKNMRKPVIMLVLNVLNCVHQLFMREDPKVVVKNLDTREN